ncbi:hypothetical protein GCM10010177_75140 [Actinomadura citrea]|nr:hypothetical protein GCM10010177_75140 [Actinomadura citrea]
MTNRGPGRGASPIKPSGPASSRSGRPAFRSIAHRTTATTIPRVAEIAPTQLARGDAWSVAFTPDAVPALASVSPGLDAPPVVRALRLQVRTPAAFGGAKELTAGIKP